MQPWAASASSGVALLTGVLVLALAIVLGVLVNVSIGSAILVSVVRRK